MGYSKSFKTLLGFYEYVKPLENMEPYTWVCETGAQGKVAYKIRECLYIARIYKDRVPKLAEAAARFTIVEVPGTNKVEARVSSAPTEALVLAGSTVSPQHGGTDLQRHAGRAVTSSGEQTVFTVIEAWNKAQPNNAPIFFSHANLPEEQLDQLWAWAQKRTPRLMIMLAEEGSFSLGVADEEVEQYAYRPAEPTRSEAEVELHEDPPVQVPIPPKPTWG